LFEKVNKFFCPTKVFFEQGIVTKLGELIKSWDKQRIFLVTDQGIKKLSFFLKIINSLKEEESLECTVFSEVETEPSVECVEKGAELARNINAEIIVGIGGGSSLDAAKAISALCLTRAPVIDYTQGLEVEKTLPVIAVPTTAGTGSEFTIWAVLADPDTKRKLSITSNKIIPRIALEDPLLTLSLPSIITAYTGIDALCHAIESYVSINAHPISETLALKAIDLISHNLENAVKNGECVSYRENMLWGSALAGMAFGSTRTGMVHGMATPLGALFHLPHGMTNALLLPSVIKYNLEGNYFRFAQIMSIIKKEQVHYSEKEIAEELPRWLKHLIQEIGLPESLKEVGVKEKDVPLLAEEAMERETTYLGPRKPTLREIKEIYYSLLE